MSRRHTPTPWHLGEMLVDPGEPGWDGTIRSAADAAEVGGDYEIARVHDEADARFIVQAANALGDWSSVRLLIAAPDLLAACEAALPAMEKALAVRKALVGEIPLGISVTVDMLRAAIRKAKGE